MVIYNCHTHLFTNQHAPERFLPRWITWLIKRKWTRFLARHIIPFTDKDLIERYINFFEVSLSGSQEEVLNRLKKYYPDNEADQYQFIVLPMDMEFMKAGSIPVSLDEQHDKLKGMVSRGEPLIPFVAIDPRRSELLTFLKKWHSQGFKGLKLYPPLGFYPNDERLIPMYEYAIEHHLPIMTHCSRGGIYIQEVTDEMLKEPNPLGMTVCLDKPKLFSDIYTDPANYDPIATQFPKLKICLAHFGGSDEWEKYQSKSTRENSWLQVILNLVQKHDNIYADISSTLFDKTDHTDLLQSLLQDSKIRERVLFGSDFYMMELEKHPERDRSKKIRKQLGEDLFYQIAHINVERYLNEKPA